MDEQGYPLRKAPSPAVATFRSQDLDEIWAPWDTFLVPWTLRTGRICAFFLRLSSSGEPLAVSENKSLVFFFGWHRGQAAISTEALGSSILRATRSHRFHQLELSSAGTPPPAEWGWGATECDPSVWETQVINVGVQAIDGNSELNNNGLISGKHQSHCYFDSWHGCSFLIFI